MAKNLSIGSLYGTILSLLLLVSLFISINEFFQFVKIEDPQFVTVMDKPTADHAEYQVRSFYDAIYKEDQFGLNRIIADRIMFQDEKEEVIATSESFISEQIKQWRKFHYWHKLHDVVVDREISNPVRVLVSGILSVQLESAEKSALDQDYTIPFSEVFELEDGKISRRITYVNQKEIERQLANR